MSAVVVDAACGLIRERWAIMKLRNIGEMSGLMVTDVMRLLVGRRSTQEPGSLLL